MPEVTSFVVVDDNHDTVREPSLKARHVQPNSLRGITDADAERICTLLQN